MSALFPDPDQLCIVSTSAPLIHQVLRSSAEPGAVLAAPGFGFVPRRLMQASTHALVRAATHAVGRIKCPPKLRAAEQRWLLEGSLHFGFLEVGLVNDSV